jgi:hypothetical protein
MQETKKISERRNEQRSLINKDIEIRVINDKQQVTAHCCNMSKSGILVQSQTLIKVGTELSLSLTDNQYGFDADGEVIRVVKDERQYLLAIKLSNIKQ